MKVSSVQPFREASSACTSGNVAMIKGEAGPYFIFSAKGRTNFRGPQLGAPADFACGGDQPSPCCGGFQVKKGLPEIDYSLTKVIDMFQD